MSGEFGGGGGGLNIFFGAETSTKEFCTSETRIWTRILGNEFRAPEFWTRIPGSKFTFQIRAQEKSTLHLCRAF